MPLEASKVVDVPSCEELGPETLDADEPKLPVDGNGEGPPLVAPVDPPADVVLLRSTPAAGLGAHAATTGMAAIKTQLFIPDGQPTTVRMQVRGARAAGSPPV